jgi:DNA polymerase-3 subunit beta
MTITATKPTTTTEPALADLEITASGTEWLRKLSAVGVVNTARPAVPILGFVLLECSRGNATVTSYDYVTSAVVKLKHEAIGPLRNTKAIAPFSWLVRTIRVLTNRKRDVPVTVASRLLLGRPMITVTAAGYTIPLVHAAPVSEFPSLPEHAEVDSLALDREELAGALDRVWIAASKDDTLPILTAIQLECSGKALTFRATDRYRLATETVQLPRAVQEFTFLLRAAAWKSMAKHLTGDKISLRVLVTADHAGRPGGSYTLSLSSGDAAFTLTGIEGDYPKIGTLFADSYERTLEVNRRDLLDQVLVAKELTEPRQPSRITMTSESVTVAPTLHEGSEALATPQLAAVTTGGGHWQDPAGLGLNPHYLLEALRSTTAEAIRFSFNELHKPICITPVQGKDEKPSSYRHLIMPVRIPSTLGGE